MGKTWVLHTETKGTGANMVPLERTRSRSSDSEPMFVPPKPRPQQPEAPKPKTPHRFKVVDVNVFVWHEERQDWRLLTLGEQRAMMQLAAGA